MKIKEVHFRYLDEDYFISLPADDFQFVEDDSIFTFLKNMGIKKLYELRSDHRNRFLDTIVDTDLAFLLGKEFIDIEIRQGKNGVYLFHIPSQSTISHDKEWLKIVDEIWKKNNIEN